MADLRDNRDPSAVGEKLIESAETVRQAYGKARKKKIPLSEIWDLHTSKFILPEYESNPTCIDKYGRPDDVEPIYASIQVV